MLYLLDTNVVCEATAKTPQSEVMDWLDANSEDCALSCITLGEIWKGIQLLPVGKRRTALGRWANGIEKDFAGATLPLDGRALKLWGQLYAKNEAKGRNLGTLDSLIAATALAHDLILVTRNTRDFPLEVRTMNPWGK